MDPQLIRAVESVGEPNWTAVVQAVGAIAAVVVGILGFLFVWLQVRHAAEQLSLTRALASNQFSLQLAQYVREYDDVHICLSKGGWPGATKGPETPEEWNRVKRYMGVLDNLQQLVEDGIHTVDQVDDWYSHRIFLLVTHPVIHEKCLVEESFAWKTFIKLWHSLESKEVYRGLVEERKRKATVAG